MNSKKQQKEIKRLSRALSKKDKALSRERRINAQLKREIARLKSMYGSADRSAAPPKSASTEPLRPDQAMIWKEERQNALLFSQKSYLRYLIHTFKSSAAGSIFQRISLYLRRLRLIRNVGAIFSAIIVTLLVSAFFITLLPFLLVLTLLALVAVCLRARAANRMISRAIDGKHVRIIIPPEGITFKNNTFLERSAKAMSQEPDTIVLVVSPHFFSTKGMGGKGIFFTARRESDQLYLIRKSYYFILRRRVLDAHAQDMTVMY